MLEDTRLQSLAVQVVQEAAPEERDTLAVWANKLLEIRNSSLSAGKQAREMLRATMDFKTILPIVKAVGREAKRIGWDDRSVPARFAMSGVAASLMLLPGKGAGIAALGSAIGVPLWVVFGSGGAFLGMLLEEIAKQARGSTTTSYTVVEAKRLPDTEQG